MLSKTMAILLGIIEEQPINAYEMIKLLTRMNVRSWCAIADSTVYATLKAALKKDYIAGEVEKGGTMPDKTIYYITEKGRAEFISTIEAFVSCFEYDVTPFSIAMFFVTALELERALVLLRERLVLLYGLQESTAAQIKGMMAKKLPALYICNARQSLCIIMAQLEGASLLLAELEKF